jgi:non-ribosomal peptide synthetase component F
VLRADLSGNPTFRELLQRVKQVTLEAYQHQNVPFAKIVNELQPERDLTGAPLFRVMLVLENTPAHNETLAGLSISSLPNVVPEAKNDLTLFLSDEAETISGTAVFSAELFNESSVAAFLDSLELVIAEVCAEPTSLISSLFQSGEDKMTEMSAAFTDMIDDT